MFTRKSKLGISAFFSGICFLSLAGYAADLTLTSPGRSRYTIVVATGATPAERTAAAELKSFVEQISGVAVPIARDKTNAGPCIYVGQSETVSKLLGGVDFSKLNPDEIILATVGEDLILSGDRPRGSLYAVYTLLEDYLGVRFWTAADTYCPKRGTITVPQLKVRYSPPFAIRETTYPDVGDPRFAARRRINGHWTQLPADFGGHEQVLGWCHTFSAILPPDTYFKKHPEWYSIVDGKRRPDGQLCLTNLEMRKEFVSRAAKWLRENSEVHLISISQNDGYGFCGCEKCQAVCQREGGRVSGPLLEFVNQVAAELEKQFPGVLVETLAYRDSRQPPKTVRPRSNVVIRLCSIEADFGSPLNSEANAAFRNDIVAWSQIAKRLFVWNYIANYANYFYPHPNLVNQARDLRFLRDHHTFSVFEQGENGSGGYGDFVPMRMYLVGKLMWNPNLNVRDLVHEFASGYYGDAGPDIEAYWKLLNDDVERTPRPRINTYLYSTRWLRLATLARAFAIMEHAGTTVAGRKPYAQRVQQAQWPITIALLTRPEVIDHPDAVAACGFGLDRLKAIAEKTLRQMGSCKIPEYAEHESFSTLTRLIEYTYGMLERPDRATLPEFCRDRSEDERIVIPNTFFQLLTGSGLVFRETDSAAIGGRAVRLATTTDSWKLIQQRLPNIVTAKHPGRWEVYVAMRADLVTGATNAGPVVKVGFCSPQTSREECVLFSGDELAGATYKYMKLGVYPLEGDDYFFIRPLENSKVKNVFIDRLILVRVR